jgi:para-nitrobenzyl esterase
VQFQFVELPGPQQRLPSTGSHRHDVGVTGCGAGLGGGVVHVGDVADRDEYSLLAAEMPDIDDADVDPLIERLTPTPGASRYHTAFPELAGKALRETVLSDWLFRMPALHLAEAAAVGGARVWLYELLWGFGPRGASHGLDTLLVFGTTDICGEVTAAGPAALAHTQRLSQTMRADHLAFATTGDPGWPRFRRRERLTRVYDPEPGLVPYAEERSRTIWRDQRFGVLGLRSRW